MAGWVVILPVHIKAQAVVVVLVLLEVITPQAASVGQVVLVQPHQFLAAA
jgi:hypothetical protein